MQPKLEQVSLGQKRRPALSLFSRQAHAREPKWRCQRGRHPAITTAISQAAELRYQNLAAKVFAIAVVYSEAIERIMTVEKVQKRQAETLFTQMNKAGLIRKNLLEQWELNT